MSNLIYFIDYQKIYFHTHDMLIIAMTIVEFFKAALETTLFITKFVQMSLEYIVSYVYFFHNVYLTHFLQ